MHHCVVAGSLLAFHNNRRIPIAISLRVLFLWKEEMETIYIYLCKPGRYLMTYIVALVVSRYSCLRDMALSEIKTKTNAHKTL